MKSIKSNFIRILGTGLVLTILVGLVIPAIPVSAVTGSAAAPRFRGSHG